MTDDGSESSTTDRGKPITKKPKTHRSDTKERRQTATSSRHQDKDHNHRSRSRPETPPSHTEHQYRRSRSLPSRRRTPSPQIKRNRSSKDHKQRKQTPPSRSQHTSRRDRPKSRSRKTSPSRERSRKNTRTPSPTTPITIETAEGNHHPPEEHHPHGDRPTMIQVEGTTITERIEVTAGTVDQEAPTDILDPAETTITETRTGNWHEPWISFLLRAGRKQKQKQNVYPRKKSPSGSR